MLLRATARRAGDRPTGSGFGGGGCEDGEACGASYTFTGSKRRERVPQGVRSDPALDTRSLRHRVDRLDSDPPWPQGRNSKSAAAGHA